MPFGDDPRIVNPFRITRSSTIGFDAVGKCPSHGRPAAVQARTNLSDFVRRRALEAAEIGLLMHPVVIITAADWERFEVWAHAPAKPVPALRELAAIRPAWQD